MFSSQHWSPKPYQERAITKLLTQGGVGLFMDPGLGKTSTVLAAFKLLKMQGYVKKMLLIAPLRPMYKVWPDEIRKWSDFNDLTYSIVHGSAVDREDALSRDVDIYIINPEGLKWLLASGWKLPEFDVLCIDESTKFKASQSQRFKLLRENLPRFKRRWILTGTPSPNGIMDLFSQIFILDNGSTLGRYITHFRNNYFNRGFTVYDWKPRRGAFEEIAEKIAPLIIQLNAEDHLDMPEIVNVNIRCDLPPVAKKMYDEVEENFISMYEEGAIVAANAAVAGVKCRQIANGAIYGDFGDKEFSVIHEAKLDALESLLEEIGGKPVLLLYEFNHDKERILARFGDIPVLGSGISEKKMSAYIDRFNTGELPVLMGHPASMGHGLNLQGSCHHVIWFGITWNLEHYDQAIARVYRQGQKSDHVFVYHIVANETLDDKVLKTLVSKTREQDFILKLVAEHGED